MKRHFKSTLTVALLFAGTAAYSQFTLSGEIRPRTEYRHGYKSVADSAQDHAVFTDQRTRLNFDYKNDGYQFKLTFQDIRTWGSTSQLNSTDGLTSVHEAWGEAFITDNFSFKFGRQEIIYDDHRIFGSVGWAQQARSHDAVIFKYKKESLLIHLGGAYNQNGPGLVGTSYTVPKNYKAIQYIWVNKAFNEQLKSSFLFLNNGVQANYIDGSGNAAYHDNYSQTVGTHTKYKKDKLSFAFNGYYQLGATNEVPARDISAYLVGLDGSYKLSDNLSATLGFEMQSGNSQTSTDANYLNVQHAFTPFYGTNHKFNGFMDYFYVGNHVGSVGLQDIYGKIKYKKDKRYVGLDVHLFSAAADVLDVKELAAAGTVQAMSSSLGTEIDLSFGTPIAKGVMLKAGYSHMLGSETLATLKGVTGFDGAGYTGAASNWAYVMIIIKPKFFEQK